jgi:hypothetical protein
VTNNLELWDKLGKTDPAHTKGFTRGGGFKGTAIKPMWSYKRMTEEFGPCGKGWGICEPSFQVVPGPEGEVLVFCTASIWYGPEKALVFGVGGDKAVGKNKYGLNSDDEAFKKAFTDAITNALKMIGVGADVHMGLFDDSKYVNTMKDEFAGEKTSDDKPKATSAAEQKRGLEAIENDLLDCHTIADVDKCAEAWAFIMNRDNWSKDYREIAVPKFAARRTAITVNDEILDFPGDKPSGAVANLMAG